MSNQDLFEAVMYVVHGKSTPCAAASGYSVPNRKILEVKIALESIKQGRGPNLV